MPPPIADNTVATETATVATNLTDVPADAQSGDQRTVTVIQAQPAAATEPPAAEPSAADAATKDSSDDSTAPPPPSQQQLQQQQQQQPVAEPPTVAVAPQLSPTVVATATETPTVAPTPQQRDSVVQPTRPVSQTKPAEKVVEARGPEQSLFLLPWY